MESCSGGSHPCQAHSTGMAGALFGNLVQTLLTAQCALADPASYPADIGSDVSEEYDFIIIGGGTAGSVMAHRLSENPQWKILLVESGGDPPITSEVPSLAFNVQQTEVDWKYKTEPQQNACKGFLEGRCNWPRGRVLGGCSTMNAMLYVRGNKEDYDNWERQGNPGWGYNDILHYFKKSQDFKNQNTNYHSSGGPQTIEYFNNPDPIKQIIFDGIKELSYEHIKDINTAHPIGFGDAPAIIRKGTRCSAAKAFLTPIKDRKNIQIVKFGMVTKIFIDPDTKQGTSIEYIKGGEILKIKASKEIILSAGTINSPQLLMLSGIGPKQHLEKLQIHPIIKDLPVGHNLQDHIVFLGSIFSVNKSNPKPISSLQILDQIYEYLTRNTGIFSKLGVTDLVGFINTKEAPKQTLYPDLQMSHLHNTVNSTLLLNSLLSVADFMPDIKRILLQENTKSDLLWIMPTVLHPKSRGSIMLSTKDPLEHPKIYANYLTDPEDEEILLNGIEFIKNLKNTKPFKDNEAEFVPLKYKDCESLTFDTREYWRCAVKYLTSTIYHPAGTCKMGPSSDPTTVVGPNLKVHDIENLRVVDASIMPTLPSGNINAAVMMIAEKAADLIKNDWIIRDEL